LASYFNYDKEGKMFFQVGKNRKIIPSWFWILVLGIPFFFFIRWLIWWFFCPSQKRVAAVEINAPRSDSISITKKQDDFSILKGIGPKTADALHSAGILTFRQLGLMDMENLQAVLRENSLPSSNAAFWQEQSLLAAKQDWEGLEKLQN
jgi:hypothetical protein